MPSGYQLMAVGTNDYLTPEQIENYNKEKVSDTQFYVFGSTQEVIDPATLFLNYQVTDYTLPGRNGMDLVLSRTYGNRGAAHSYYHNEYYMGAIHTYASKKHLGYSDIGVGWRFNVPSVGENVITFEDGSQIKYACELVNGVRTYTLVNHKANDIAIEDNGSTQTATNIKVTKKDGTCYYISLDSITKEDRFGNAIHYEYIYNALLGRSVLNRIYDDLNRQIVFNHTANLITATLPDGNTIKYHLQDSVYMPQSGTVTSPSNKELASVENQKGLSTSYTYEGPTVAIGGSANMYFSNLTKITHYTGLETRYTYASRYGNTDDTFGASYFYVTSRLDYDGTTECNKINYYKTNPSTGEVLNDYTGYPQYTGSIDDLPDNVYNRTYAIAEKSTGTQTQYYNYNSDMRLSQMNEGSKTIMYQYDTATNLPSRILTGYVSTAYGRTLEDFTYDAKGNVLTHSYYDNSNEKANRTTTYTYDSTYSLLLTSAQTVNGIGGLGQVAHEIWNTLSADKKTIISSTDYQRSIGLMDGRTTNYTYDIYGNMIKSSKILLQNDSAITFEDVTEYDANGLYPVKTYTNRIEGGQATVLNEATYSYGSNTGRLNSKSDKEDETITYSYDALGRQTGQIKTVNNGQASSLLHSCTQVNLSYNDTAQTVTCYGCMGDYVTNNPTHPAAQRPSKLIYDKFGRLCEIQLRNDDGIYETTETYTYTRNGLLASYTTYDGLTVTYSYNTKDELTQMAYPDGYAISINNQYVANMATYGVTKEVTMTDTAGLWKKGTYDAFGQLIKEQTQHNNDPNAIVTEYVYDYAGNITQQTGQTSASYAYNAFGDVISSNVGSLTTSYTYDAFGNLASKTYSGTDTSRNCTYTYYAPGAPSVLTIGSGENAKTETWTYNEYLQPLTYKQKNGQVTNYTYTYSNQLASFSTAKDGKTYGVSYDYDLHGNALKKTDLNTGDYIAYTYGITGGPTNITRKIGDYTLQVKDITYDLTGRLLSFKDDRNTQTSYTYNELGKVSTVNTSPMAYSTINYAYHTDGTLQSKSLYYTSQSYEYYEDKRLKGIDILNNVDGTKPLPQAELDYTYDSKGNIASETLAQYPYRRTETTAPTLTNTNNYTYTDINQLDVAQTQTAADGQTTTKTLTNTYNAQNQFIRKDTIQPGSTGPVSTYIGLPGTNGHISTINQNYYGSVDYDANGNLKYENNSGGIAKEYVYDPYNRLAAYYEGPSTDADNLVAEYTYDCDGIRQSKTVNGQTTIYLTFGGVVLSEYTVGAGGALVFQASNIIANGQIEGRIIGGYAKMFVKNAHGDVLAALSFSESPSATFQTYDAWGNRTNDALGNIPIGYAGEYWDAETNFIYLRARYYDPDFNRFITQDPSKHGDDWYGYCYNNPMNYVDPTGKVPKSEPWFFSGANCYAYAMNLKGSGFRHPGQISGNQQAIYTSQSMSVAIKGDAAALGMSATEATEEQIQGKNLGKNQWVIMAFGSSAPNGATATSGTNSNPAYPEIVNTMQQNGHAYGYVLNEDGSVTIYITDDYHFYRQNGDGYGNFDGTWSHKPGTRSVSNVDSNGNVITDPRNASRRVVIERGTFKFSGKKYEIVADYGRYLGAYVITGNMW